MKRAFFLIFSLFISISVNAQSLDWAHLDFQEDGVYGMSTNKAYKELLKDKTSTPIIVGVLDSGVDIEHQDLKEVIWVNAKEIENNGKDDDGNGFIDDIHGWDFLGAKNGEDVWHEQLEITRLTKQYDDFFGPNPKKRKIRKNEEKYNSLKEYQQTIKKELEEANQNYKLYNDIYSNFLASNALLEEHLDTKELTVDAVRSISTDASNEVLEAKAFYLRMAGLGLKPSDVKEGVDYFKSRVDYNYNVDYSPRAIIGDDPDKLEYKSYGNNEVTGPDAMHGTHVSGIIAADRTNDIGVKGVADNAKILVVRCVPDGDELDKDVANAIRYAVDNGAKVINMSFGKAFSPNKIWVDEAVEYAAKNDVLIVAAAGNESEDVDEHPHYPSRNLLNNKVADNWISVGALDFKAEPNLAAGFSNYGKNGVDIFAPGVAIYSTVPNNGYSSQQGTSMASPEVAGLAALLRSYFPNLSAKETKDIILNSAVKLDKMTILPGTSEQINFLNLSTTGGIANTYEAVKLAMKK